MADCVLSNGTEVKIDLSKITVKEYDDLKNPAFIDEASYLTIEKCTGIAKSDIEPLPMDDLRKIVGGIIKKASRPITDPN